MYRVLTLSLLLALVISGCTSKTAVTDPQLNAFIEKLGSEGVKGSLEIGAPINDDMEYVATYVISAYTSTRILSFFRCKDTEVAERNLEEAMKNPKLTGSARKGTMIMAATFYPPDDQAVEQIRQLFLTHHFD